MITTHNFYLVESTKRKAEEAKFRIEVVNNMFAIYATEKKGKYSIDIPLQRFVTLDELCCWIDGHNEGAFWERMR